VAKVFQPLPHFPGIEGRPMANSKFIKWLKENHKPEIELIMLDPLPGDEGLNEKLKEGVKGITEEEVLKDQKKAGKNLFKYLESTIKNKWN
jgi:hypothetical protein